ncbi:MAG TPA: ATP-binding protein [Anaeromyxobacteraceae bacterium]|nr:ATP-binding protein [Anaeromyxobacteraceae bacterium]
MRKGVQLRKPGSARRRKPPQRRGRSRGDLEARELLEELRAHQLEMEMQKVELETQNESLRAVQAKVQTGLERYTQLFDFAPIGYFTITAEGLIREVNLTGAHLLSVARSQLVGRRFLAFVVGADRAAAQDFLGQVLSAPAGQKSRSCEVRLHGERRQRIEVRLTASVMQGEAPTALVAVEDVSARVRAERDLRQEVHHKDEFLAVLSHELRNPLAPIRNSLGVLEQGAQGEQARRAHEVIGRQVAQLTRLVEDLLDVTRITRGKVRLHTQRVELTGLVASVVDDHRAGFAASGILLADRLAPAPLWVDADSARLVQVLGNLLANAQKFTDRGGRVEVELERGDANAFLRVRDDGSGLATELLPALFKPFVQAPQSADRPAGGLGLGLAMVKGIVALHGGSVHAASAGPGRGSAFTVQLPLAPATTPPEQPAQARLASSGRRVLIIDDNEDSTDSLGELLALQGHDVRVAYDGPKGLALARDFKPEVVLCDIGLPGMDGYQVARALRAEEATNGPCLVALTGYALPDDLRRAREAGFDKHVAKPPSMEGLLQLLSELPRRAPTAGGGTTDRTGNFLTK